MNSTTTITSGVSPKVSLPAVALAAFGLVVAVAGLLLKSEALATVGVTAIGSGVAGGFIGYQAPAGDVLVHQEVQPVADPGPASDDLLPDEARAAMAQEPPAA